MELLIPIAATLLCSSVGMGVLDLRIAAEVAQTEASGILPALGTMGHVGRACGHIPRYRRMKPRIESDAAIIGRWQGDGFELRLERDSSFALSSSGSKTIGRWRRNDWGLNLTADDHSVRDMRFVEDGGTLLLLPEPPQVDMRNDPGPIMKRD